MHHERVMLGNWCDHSWNFEFWEQNVSNHKRLLDKPCIWVKHPLVNAFAVFSSQHSLSEPALISHCYIDAYISAIEILGKTSLRFLSWRLRLSDLVLNNALILSDDFSLNIWPIVILVTCWFSGYRKSAMIPILPCDVNHTLLIFIALIYCWFIAMLFDVVQRSERLNEFKNHLSKSTMHCFLTTICNLQQSSKRYESRHLQSTLIEGNERGSEQILNISSESLPTLSSPILSNHAFPDM